MFKYRCIMELNKQQCKPCRGDDAPLDEEKIQEYKRLINDQWSLIDGQKISRRFKWKNFRQSIAFINQIAEIAEQEQHHPDLGIAYNKVTVDLSTHAINGLSENDFIMAAKIDEMAEQR